MIQCDLFGRLGNNMFQIATTIATSIEVGTTYEVPEQSLNRQEWPLLFEHFPKITHGAKTMLVKEAQDFSWTPIPKVDNLRLHGYWQNENYFKDHREAILKEFRIPWKLNKGTVSIHIRRGDYVFLPTKHPVISHEYIKQAIKYFYDRDFRKFMVFSDDIEWCKEYFTYYDNTGIEFEYSEGAPLEDLSSMSGCEHNIIANSTFSWWAGWANRNPDKIVVSPSKYNWFGPDNAKKIKTDGIIPDSWIQIKY